MGYAAEPAIEAVKKQGLFERIDPRGKNLIYLVYINFLYVCTWC